MPRNKRSRKTETPDDEPKKQYAPWQDEECTKVLAYIVTKHLGVDYKISPQDQQVLGEMLERTPRSIEFCMDMQLRPMLRKLDKTISDSAADSAVEAEEETPPKKARKKSK